MRVRFTKLLGRRSLALLTGLVLLFFLLPSDQYGVNVDGTASVLPKFEGKRAIVYSPFYKLANALSMGKSLSKILQASEKYHQIGTEWQRLKLQDKCRYYFESTAEINAEWSNDAVKTFHNENNLDDPLAELMMERIRMYDTCFLSGGLSWKKVFHKSKVDPTKLESRIFPFLSKTAKLRDMWPVIIDANHWTQTPKFSNPLLEGKDTWKLDDNHSFFYNWNMFASGKGIAMSLGLRHLDQFKKLLLTLEALNNTLPIQVVYNGAELTEFFLDDVHRFLNINALSQRVYFVNIGPLIDKSFASNYVKYFVNKWMALLFNTFSECILMDADVVSFTKPESYFDMNEYKNTGMLMFRDRNIIDEHTFKYCTDTMRMLFPSSEETILMDHKPTFPSSLIGNDNVDVDALSIEESIFYKFFIDLQLHHVDSGLVVVDRSNKLPSLLASAMININGKLQRCVYGDKEIFWLGQLLMGSNYSVYPTEGSVMGEIQELPDNSTQICGTQMAHVSTEGELLWSNGGLMRCKVQNSAELDFDHDPEYFEKKYGNVIQLQSLYNQPLTIRGYITPDVSHFPWEQVKECHQYTYCATVKDNMGKLVRLDTDKAKHLSNIAEIWNSDVRLAEKT
ncbi:alpha-1,3-mannosyltransferase [Kluyveromyces marxianus]|uniref:Alpha-1-3-mannosyltransferase n=1 Tax=Kluyveromyces marxianus TaxID=4911 RepID=A0ABX6EWM6_KLUMA|nr:alpha-1-3-mannosyltransferase [Kluyveromyces marxianus]BAP72483.1 alpha-1,3-mannosyltransferase [Kluyveromyces marxianus]